MPPQPRSINTATSGNGYAKVKNMVNDVGFIWVSVTVRVRFGVFRVGDRVSLSFKNEYPVE